MAGRLTPTTADDLERAEDEELVRDRDRYSCDDESVHEARQPVVDSLEEALESKHEEDSPERKAEVRRRLAETFREFVSFPVPCGSVQTLADDVFGATRW